MIDILNLLWSIIDQFLPHFMVKEPQIDCSNWVPPEEFYPGGVWPDGSPIEPGAQCGVERW